MKDVERIQESTDSLIPISREKDNHRLIPRRLKCIALWFLGNIMVEKTEIQLR